jgi:hypothetical protein
VRHFQPFDAMMIGYRKSHGRESEDILRAETEYM